MHSFLSGHLPEGDLTLLLKVLFAHLLLSGLKLGHIGVMALFHILVIALKDGLFLKSGDRGLLAHAAHAVGLGLTAGEVHTAGNGDILRILSSATAAAATTTVVLWLATMVPAESGKSVVGGMAMTKVVLMTMMVGTHKGSGKAKGQKELEMGMEAM